jgi:hypothetical protein
VAGRFCLCDTVHVGDASAAAQALSAARTRHAEQVARRLGHTSPASLPSWVLELIRDCLAEGYQLAHEAPTIPPRPQRPGAYSFDELPAEEVTQVGWTRRRGG